MICGLHPHKNTYTSQIHYKNYIPIKGIYQLVIPGKTDHNTVDISVSQS
jgi:hypothetical protein